MAETIIMSFFVLILYGVLILTYLYPEESMLFGQRWMYKEEPEFSETSIRVTKLFSSSIIFLITIVIVTSFIKIPLVGLFLFLALFIYFSFGLYQLIYNI